MVGYTYDFNSGNFAFCRDSELMVSFEDFDMEDIFSVNLFCDGHDNYSEYTRGRTQLVFEGNRLRQVSVVGEIKGFLFWSTETSIQCTNLVRNN